MLLSAHMYIRNTCCTTSGHLMQAFCIGEFCSGSVSTKLLTHYTFLENILIKGKARNKHRPVNERKSSYTMQPLPPQSVAITLSALHYTGKVIVYAHGRRLCFLVGCFGFNDPLRQYFSLYRAISKRGRKRRKDK